MRNDELAMIVTLLAIMTPITLSVIGRFLIRWREADGGNKRLVQALGELRQEIAELRRDYARAKADQNDTLLGLTQDVQRLEGRLDRQAGIDAPPPAPRVPTQRQL